MALYRRTMASRGGTGISGRCTGNHRPALGRRRGLHRRQRLHHPAHALRVGFTANGIVGAAPPAAAIRCRRYRNSALSGSLGRRHRCAVLPCGQTRHGKHAHAGVCVWRLRHARITALSGQYRPPLVGARLCLCAGQCARRRRIRPCLAPRRTRRAQTPQCRRLAGGGGRYLPARPERARLYGDSRRQQRRLGGGIGVLPPARTAGCAGVRSTAHRYAALSVFIRRCLMAGRIRRPRAHR